MVAQPSDQAAVLQQIDSAVEKRNHTVAGYTVIEHYRLYRGSDQANPAAEMTVKTTYDRQTGKSYEVLSETGSAMLKKFVFTEVLDNEKALNLPGAREKAWLTTANYNMTLTPGGPRRIDGRVCFEIGIVPRQPAQNLIHGTLWVDAQDGSIVRIDGSSSKSVSIFTGATHVMRQYQPVNGFAMATHARAESDSFLFGHSVMTIDYNDYKMQLDSGK